MLSPDDQDTCQHSNSCPADHGCGWHFSENAPTDEHCDKDGTIFKRRRNRRVRKPIGRGQANLPQPANQPYCYQQQGENRPEENLLIRRNWPIHHAIYLYQRATVKFR